MALIFFTVFKDYDVEHLWVCQPSLRGRLVILGSLRWKKKKRDRSELQS